MTKAKDLFPKTDALSPTPPSVSTQTPQYTSDYARVFEPIALLQEEQRKHRLYFKGMPSLHIELRNFISEWCFASFEESATLFIRSDAEQLGLPSVPEDLLFEYYHKSGCSYEHAFSFILAAWRSTKGIFRFDADLLATLAKTSNSQVLPSASMLRLPHWCVYLDVASRLTWERSPIHGLFAMIYQESEDRPKPLLALLLNTEQNLQFFALPLGGLTLNDALEEADRISQAAIASQGVSTAGLVTSDPTPEDLSEFAVDFDAVREEIPALLNVLLYLCADNVDFANGTRPAKPKPAMTRKGPKLFSALAVTEWNVGVRVGAELRRAQGLAELSFVSDAPPAASSRPRPHVRCAHWHHYWTGPKLTTGMRNGGDVSGVEHRADASKAPRKLVLRWIAPTLVNVTNVETLPAVVRAVSSRTSDGNVAS